MSDQEAAQDPAYPVVYRYNGDGSQYIMGVPARDLTVADYDLLEDGPREDLQGQLARSDGLYSRVTTLAESRQAVKTGKRRRGGKKSTQVDPDPNTPGRTDSDVVNSGQAVPPSDEPIGEGAAGFTKADTGGSAQEG